MKYDIIIVGSGPGGYVAAIRAAQLGKKVALVERSEPGGVCLNWGCIPTKALLKSAQVYTYCKSAEHYGISLTGEVHPNLEKIVARSRGVAETMSKGVAFLLKKNNIDLIQGFGRLTAAGRLDVGGTHYEADHIILATGARPREMAFMPVDGEHVISSRQALTLTRLPETMVVVGSGAIGSEFAWFYAALGVKVTVVEYMPRMMPLEDEEVSKAMERAFRKLRAAVMTSTTVKSVRVNAEGRCEVEIEGKKGPETLTADIVLSAVGIKSNIEGIGLEELGIAVERDKVLVDQFYRTNVPGVYAIGDIVGGPALAHVASAYKVGRFPFTASGKATAAGDRDGFVKLLFGEDDTLLGAHMVGQNVTEMIAEPTLARMLGATAHRIARTIHAHPTMNEGVMEAAEAALGEAIHL